LDESSNSEASPAAITQADIDSLWPRFCAAVYDALVRPAARSLPAFRAACHALWPRFIAPLVLQQQQQQPNGASHPVYTAKDFSKLLVAARTHFQDETVLNPSIISARPSATLDRTTAPSSSSSSSASPTTTDLATLLPRTARVLLMCAYLASHNPARHDLALFSTHHRLTRKRRSHGHGRASSHRKIARKLLGAHAFVLERMLAIYAAVRGEWLDEDASRSTASLDGDVGTALATLSSLRLLNRVGAGADVMDRGAKWRINVGWEVVRGVGRSMGVEVEEWLME
jgi:origin recognition complex subunit 5